MRLPGVVEGTIAHVRPKPIASRSASRRRRTSPSKSRHLKPRCPDSIPVILVFEPGGTEVATNVYTKRNNNGLYMMKMIQPKVTLSLHAPGEYQMEIRDITTDRAGDDFRYRVLVRRQIPHVGRVEVAEDQINLRPGATRELNITVEREEGFNGLVAFAAEGLPAGVIVIARGAETDRQTAAAEWRQARALHSHRAEFGTGLHGGTRCGPN